MAGPAERTGASPAPAELGAYVALTALGLGLRLYDLGSRALHHDESLHALFAWYLYQGRGYAHDPMMHGPFQFHALALIYFLFGDSDATARLLAALCGTAAIGACYWLRPWLGRIGALTAALLLTFSPIMLYFSRFARNDIIIAFWNLLIVLGLWDYVARRRPAALILAAGAIGLGFATKEVTFITVAIFGVFFGLRLLRELFEAAGPDPAAALRTLTSPAKAPLYLAPLVVVGGLSLPQFSAGVELPAAWLGFGPLAPNPAYPPPWAGLAAGGLAGALVAGSLGAGLLGIRPGLALGLAVLPFGAVFPLAPAPPDHFQGLLLNLALYGGATLSAWGLAGRPAPADLSLFAAGGGLVPSLIYRVALMSGGPPPAWAGLVVAALIGLTVGVGLAWERRLWPVLLGVFYVPYTLLYTTFLTNLPGFSSGIWGSLQYWLLQHEVQRGAQPWYYYLLLLPIYEFLPITLGLAGLVLWTHRTPPVRLWALSVALAALTALFLPGEAGRLGALSLLGLGLLALGLAPVRDLTAEFRLFLIFWAAATFIGYAIAGEKMPWLGVHLTLPLILAAGRAAQDLSGGDLHPLKDPRPWLAAVAGLLGLFTLVGLWRLLGGRHPPEAARAAALGLAVLGFAYLAWLAGRQLGRRGILLGAGVLVGLILFGFTVRAAVLASYYHGDTPVEMLVYTQTSPEIPRLLRRVEELAMQTGQGRDLPITVDATSGFSWPWAWYLRHYKQVDYPTLNAPAGPPRGVVLFLHSANEQAMRPYLDRYGPGQRYPHRWWFPEDYKSAAEWIRAVTPPDERDRLTFDPASPPGFKEAVAATLKPDGLGRLWRYFVYRETLNPLGSEDGIFYVARELSPRTEAPAQPPQAGLMVLSSFGRPGRNPGEFNGPRGIAVGPDGSVYVADSLNHRVQKFDPTGRFLAQVGSQGSGFGQFQEPWGVAVGPDGSVYVADTWNHRVQKFDPNLRFVTAWGEFAAAGPDPQAAPGKFYGPRDIAVDGSGRVFVTDTGNKRVQVFGPDGQYLLAFGGPGTAPGRFEEPVGLKFDLSGQLWVADTWNRRLQVFDADLRPLAQIPVPGWAGTGILNKPYLAAAPDGSVWVTDPEGGRLLRLGPGGGPVTPFTGPFGLPVGLAFDREGRLLASDGAGHRVLRLGLPGS